MIPTTAPVKNAINKEKELLKKLQKSDEENRTLCSRLEQQTNNAIHLEKEMERLANALTDAETKSLSSQGNLDQEKQKLLSIAKKQKERILKLQRQKSELNTKLQTANSETTSQILKNKEMVKSLEEMNGRITQILQHQEMENQRKEAYINALGEQVRVAFETKDSNYNALVQRYNAEKIEHEAVLSQSKLQGKTLVEVLKSNAEAQNTLRAQIQYASEQINITNAENARLNATNQSLTIQLQSAVNLGEVLKQAGFDLQSRFEAFRLIKEQEMETLRADAIQHINSLTQHAQQLEEEQRVNVGQITELLRAHASMDTQIHDLWSRYATALESHETQMQAIQQKYQDVGQQYAKLESQKERFRIELAILDTQLGQQLVENDMLKKQSQQFETLQNKYSMLSRDAELTSGLLAIQLEKSRELADEKSYLELQLKRAKEEKRDLAFAYKSALVEYKKYAPSQFGNYQQVYQQLAGQNYIEAMEEELTTSEIINLINIYEQRVGAGATWEDIDDNPITPKNPNDLIRFMLRMIRDYHETSPFPVNPSEPLSVFRTQLQQTLNASGEQLHEVLLSFD